MYSKIALISSLGALAISLGANATILIVDGGNNKEAREAHDALCTFRKDLEVRADQTRKFINDLTSGKRDPIPGITVADLELSEGRSRSTMKSLDDSGLTCP